MRKKSENLATWLNQPAQNHCVTFYRYESEIISIIESYVAGGLAADDTCIVIATNQHLEKLEQRLGHVFDLQLMRARHQYVSYAVDKTMNKFMRSGLPDKQLFVSAVLPMMDEAKSTGRPVRIYGEIVATLWKDGNQEGLMQLEKLWSELLKRYDFSVLCAYPKLQNILPEVARSDVRECHNLCLESIPAEMAAA